MSNVTAIQPAGQTAVAPFFSPEQEKMILSSFLGGASRDEAAVLMEVAKVRRLNPLLRQIHFVKRYDHQKGEQVWSYQTSIDGLRTIAERTGRYEGQTAPQWCGTDGKWRDVWLDKEPPAAARVGVYKTSFREPLYGIARWGSYVQTKRDGSVTAFWSRMPDLMLSKCAEAIALRKAFPEDMSGLYTGEEMGAEAATVEDIEPPVTRAQLVQALVADPAAHQTPPAEPAKPTRPALPPPHVAALWTRAKQELKGNAKAEFEKAAAKVFGDAPKPTHEWSIEDTQKVERAIFDVDF